MRQQSVVALGLLLVAAALVPAVAGQMGGNGTAGNGTADNTSGQTPVGSDPTQTNTSNNATGPQAAVGAPQGSSPWPPLFIILALALLVGYFVTRSTLRRGK